MRFRVAALGSIACLMAGFACVNPDSAPPVATICPIAIGDLVPRELNPDSSRVAILAGPGRFIRSVELDGPACRFTLGFDQDLRVRYIHCRDPRVRSVEGYAIGTPYARLAADGRPTPTPLPGWGYYMPLAGGWCAGFHQGPRLASDQRLAMSAEIAWFFRGGPMNAESSVESERAASPK